jgi:hypothetical protein
VDWAGTVSDESLVVFEVTRSQLRFQNSQSCSRVQLLPVFAHSSRLGTVLGKDCRVMSDGRSPAFVVVVLLAFAWTAACCFAALIALVILVCEVFVGSEASNVAWAAGTTSAAAAMINVSGFFSVISFVF